MFKKLSGKEVDLSKEPCTRIWFDNSFSVGINIDRTKMILVIEGIPKAFNLKESKAVKEAIENILKQLEK